MLESVKLIECPRDAWQGLPKIIPTEAKTAYLRKLIEAGFRHIDAVSFVAPQYVPQMADSEKVMRSLADTLKSATNGQPPEIIGIVVNEKGLERALGTPGVTTVGYPYSVSARFRRANANMSLEESRALVQKLRQAAVTAGLDLVVYISMAFGNPYDEPWGPEIVQEAVVWLKSVGTRMISLADTVGAATPKGISELFGALHRAAPEVELGLHLHSRAEGAAEKILAAYEAGCRRFDSALTGLGGCPFASDHLVGNIPTEIVVETLASHDVRTGIEPWAMLAVVEASQKIRSQYEQ